jgi:hypothetical protein
VFIEGGGGGGQRRPDERGERRFILKKTDICQDRLGTNRGKALKKDGTFSPSQVLRKESGVDTARLDGIKKRRFSAIYEPFVNKDDHFTKTGSGQT